MVSVVNTMTEEAPQEKTIGLAETIFVLLLVGIEEFFEFLILVITLGAGILVTEPMNLAMASLIEMYMIFRGGRGVMKLIVQPIGASINAFTANLAPGKTIALAAGIWLINNPEKMEKATGVITQFTGTIVTAASTAVGGVVGGAAAKIAGGKIAGAGVSATRARMAMATGASSGKISQVNRLLQARAQAQQNMSKDTLQGIPEHEEPVREAA